MTTYFRALLCLSCLLIFTIPALATPAKTADIAEKEIKNAETQVQINTTAKAAVENAAKLDATKALIAKLQKRINELERVAGMQAEIQENLARRNVSSELRFLEERIKRVDEKLQTRILAAEQRAKLENRHINKILNANHSDLNSSLNRTLFAIAFGIICLAAVVLVGMRGWLGSVVRNLARKELSTQLEGEDFTHDFQRKTATQVDSLLSELTDKAQQRISEVRVLRRRYDRAVRNMGACPVLIDRVPEKVSEDLEAFADTLPRIKTEEDYTAQDWTALAIQALREGNKDNASIYLEEALEQAPDSPETNFNLGSISQKSGKFDEAIAYYDKTVKLAPKFLPGHICRGQCLLAMGRFEQALHDFNRAVKLTDTPSSDALYNRAYCYAMMGQHKQAIDAYTRCIKEDPNDARAWYGRGYSHSETKRPMKAIADYNKAIELEPAMITPYLNLVELLITTDQYQDALETLQIVSNQKPTPQEQTTLCYLNAVAVASTGAETADADRRLRRQLAGGTSPTWSFEPIEHWLKTSDMSEQAAAYIREATALMRAHRKNV
ncbi:MAG: tetratricopeptide repeat protein [Desulfovibrio sp.]